MYKLLDILKKVLKWSSVFAFGFIVLMVSAGLLARLFANTYDPPGSLYDVGGFSLHLHCRGENKGNPTVIVENGAGASSPAYYWLQEKLYRDTRVCLYDRSGLGFSELGDTDKGAETVARQLHALLRQARIEPPLLLAGHSLGGPYIRVYTELYPDDVSGLMFLDASHPEQIQRFGQEVGETPGWASFIPILYDLGIVHLFKTLFGTGEDGGDLPTEQTAIYSSFDRNGKGTRGALPEVFGLPEILSRAGRVSDFGELPILVFSAGSFPIPLAETPEKSEKMQLEWAKMQAELAEMSSNGKQFTLDNADHSTIFTLEKNAEFIAKQTREMLREISKN